VTNVGVSLVCGGRGRGIVATTNTLLHCLGDGKAGIKVKIKLPGVCFGPISLARAAAFDGSLLPRPAAVDHIKEGLLSAPVAKPHDLPVARCPESPRDTLM
jgi:hypothetical protein